MSAVCILILCAAFSVAGFCSGMAFSAYLNWRAGLDDRGL